MGDFRVVSAGDLADEIVARLECSTIPAEIGKWVAKQAEHGELWQQNVIYGLGGEALTQYFKMKPDGSLHMQLADINQRPFWEITLRPPRPDCPPERTDD